jgi:hypothetical protein
MRVRSDESASNPTVKTSINGGFCGERNTGTHFAIFSGSPFKPEFLKTVCRPKTAIPSLWNLSLWNKVSLEPKTPMGPSYPQHPRRSFVVQCAELRRDASVSIELRN